MQDAAYCRAQALLLRERAAKARTPEEWLACLNAAKAWDHEADRQDGGVDDEAGPEAEAPPAAATAEPPRAKNMLRDL